MGVFIFTFLKLKIVIKICNKKFLKKNVEWTITIHIKKSGDFEGSFI